MLVIGANHFRPQYLPNKFVSNNNLSPGSSIYSKSGIDVRNIMSMYTGNLMLIDSGTPH